MKRKLGMLLGLAVVAGVASCVDLDEKLVGVLTTDYYLTPAGVDAAVSASYSALRNFWGREESQALTQMGTDTWTNGDQGGYKYLNFYDAGLNASSAWISFPWNAFYQAINTTNAVLDRADGITGVDPAVKRSRLAEVHYLRGLYYFWLVQMYGPLDVSLTENKGVRTDATRQSEDSVYKVIIADLQYAVDSLPETQSQYGRATKWAAMHFLAKVYLTRAYKSYGAGATDFAMAAQLSQAVINQAPYALVSDFRSLFCGPPAAGTPSNGTGFCPLQGYSETNSEFIFTVQESWDEAQFADNTGNALHLWFLSFYDDLPGTTRNINDGRAWRRLRPTPYAIGLWQRWSGAPGASEVLDTRYDASFQSVWIAVRDGTGGAGTSGGPITIGDTIRWDPPYEVDDAFRLSVPYRIVAPSQYDEFRYPSLKKWQDNQRPNFNETDGGRDIPLARLGETYLIAAEALYANGAGDAGAAANMINMVRRRAVNPTLGTPNALDITAGDVTLDFIMDERERELSGELHRWFDLVRPGPAYFVARVKAHNAQAAANVQEYHALRPIPQAQLDLVSTDFPQNPGY